MNSDHQHGRLGTDHQGRNVDAIKLGIFGRLLTRDVVPLCPTWLQVLAHVTFVQSSTTVVSGMAQRIAELSAPLVVHTLEGLVHLIHVICIILENLLATGVVFVLRHSWVRVVRISLEHVLLHRWPLLERRHALLRVGYDKPLIIGTTVHHVSILIINME